MRPLTAYHIFFQIEREYIIQTTAGPVADKSMHDNKSYRLDVPRRYRCIKLLPDWYAGPGKRQKRKHRKSHGKIGFLELSRVISGKWATLSTTDPETKRFVTLIAARELDEYKLEMKQYKELAKNVATSLASAGVITAAVDTVGAMISPSTSPGPSSCPMEILSSTLPPMIPRLNEPMEPMPVENAELVLSLEDYFACSASSTGEDEIDYSICSVSNNGNYIPSPGPTLSSDKSNMIQPTGTIYDPLFELEDGYSFLHPAEKRCVSPVSSEMNVDSVDNIGDGGFLQLLSC